MIALALALNIALQDGTQKTEGDQLFSKMIAKYAAAKTISGTVDFLQTATVGGVFRRAEIQTNVAFQAPNKFRIAQVNAERGVSFSAVCDGKQMNYSAPQDWVERGKPRVFEVATKDMATNLEAFAILLPDRSFPIALALYSTKEIKYTVYRLRNLKIEGQVEFNGANASKVVATYILDDGNGRMPASVTLAYFYITKDGDLVGITREETFGGGPMKDNKGNIVKQESYKINSQWLVNLKIDQPLDESLFKLSG